MVYHSTIMSDLICTCKCGCKIRVSEFAVGMRRRCGQCGEAFVIGPENTVALETPARQPVAEFAARSNADAKAFPGPHQCARCGKPFKGEWDRYSTSKGVVCHICASLVAQETGPGQKERPTPLAPPPPLAAGIRIEPAQPPPQTGEETYWDRFEKFRETKAFRAGLYAAAFSVIAIAIYYSFFYTFPELEKGRHPEDVSETGKAETASGRTRLGLGLLGPPEELTESQHGGIRLLERIVEMILRLLTFYLAILLTERWSGGGPPGSTWYLGALYIGLVSVLCVLLGFIPFIGWAISLYVVYKACSFNLWDFCTFVLLRIAFSFLMIPIRALLFGAVSLVLF